MTYPTITEVCDRFGKDRGGSTSVIMALMVPMLVAGIGFGVETGLWYSQQRGLQHAADVAAHAAAVRLNSGADQPAMRSAALYVAEQSGFAIADDAFFVASPASTGPNAGEEGTVEVRVSMTQPRLFSAILDDTPINISARAVARVEEQSNACVLALSRTASGAISVGGSTSILLDGCDVASNSNANDAFDMFGAAALDTGCINTVGGASSTHRLRLSACESINENSGAVADPYRNVPEPEIAGTCQDANVGQNGGGGGGGGGNGNGNGNGNNNENDLPAGSILTPTENHSSGVNVMRFCSGLSIKGAITMDPGLYIVENGDFTLNGNASIEGTGVTIFLTGGAEVKITGNGTLDLAAPTSGPFSNLLFFGGRDQFTAEHRFAGTTDAVFQGAIYTPASDVKYRGTSDLLNGCTQIIANTVNFNGNASLGSSCEENGGRNIISEAAVKIIE